MSYLHRLLVTLWLTVVVSAPSWAVYGRENPRLQRLYERYMSPSCWQQNLTLHDSPIAHELRASIQTMLQNGRSDDEIKEALVGQYGKRILVLPEGEVGDWLFVTPWVIAGISLLALTAFFRHVLRPRPGFVGPPPAALEDG